MASTFLLICLGHLFLADGLPAQVLTHGPVVGGVTDAEAKVFVRSDQAATVAIQYGTDPALQGAAVSGSMQTDAAGDFTAIVPLPGLTAETTYYLNVLVDDVPQLAQSYPYFTTFAPAGSSRDFKFAVLTDFHSVSRLTAPVQTFASASAELPSFVFIGGDFDHRQPETLSARRNMFKQLYDPETPFMSDFVPLILRRMAIAHQWDDHDSGHNNIDKIYPGWADAQEVYDEYVPGYPLPSVTPGIWQKFSYAQAEFFILDCRSQRDPASDPNGPDKSMLDGNNLGSAGELEWLENGLLTSTAKWKVIFTSVVTNPSTKQNDGWGAYPTEWNSLKDFILTNNILNVVFISGDLHLDAIDNGSQSGFPEMCVAGANRTENYSCATALNGSWSEGFYDETCAGFGLVSILQNPDRLVLEGLDEFGIIRLAYTVLDGIPPPTPTPTATPTPTPTPEPPVIKREPRNQRVEVGQTATFRVAASGAAPLTYQWTKNGTEISGAVAAGYRTPPATTDDSGSLFAVIVSNPGGSVASSAATLLVRTASVGSIITPPGETTVPAGQSPASAPSSAQGIADRPVGEKRAAD